MVTEPFTLCESGRGGPAPGRVRPIDTSTAFLIPFCGLSGLVSSVHRTAWGASGPPDKDSFDFLRSQRNNFGRLRCPECRGPGAAEGGDGDPTTLFGERTGWTGWTGRSAFCRRDERPNWKFECFGLLLDLTFPSPNWVSRIPFVSGVGDAAGRITDGWPLRSAKSRAEDADVCCETDNGDLEES
jgi:hypothetical protein